MSQPDNFEMLAVYNAERARGIMHTPEMDARMAELQREFYEWQNSLPLPAPRRRTVRLRLSRFLFARERIRDTR